MNAKLLSTLVLVLALALAACGKQPLVSLGGDEPTAMPPANPEGGRDAATPTDPDASTRLPPDAGIADSGAMVVDTGIPDGIDLTATFIPRVTNMVRPGETLSVDVSVANLGSRRSSAVFLRLFLEPAGLLIVDHAVEELAGRATTSEHITIVIPPSIATGDYELFAIVDPQEIIHELDETNNIGEPLPLVITHVTASATSIDFGQVALGCSSQAHTIVSNTGETSADLRRIDFHVGSTSELWVPNLTPYQLFPGATLEIPVTYTPAAEGVDTATLHIQHSDALTPINVEVRGEGVTVVYNEESYVSQASVIDFLFVVDSSGSMAEEQENLARNIRAFTSWLQQNGIDYHIGVTSMDLDASGPQGSLIGAPAVLTPAIPDAFEQLEDRVLLGVGSSGLEQGFEAAYLALTEPMISTVNAGFLRPNGGLAVIFISDEDDQSLNSVDFYATFFRGVKGAEANATINAIAGDVPNGCFSTNGSASSGTRYLELSLMLDGIFESICREAWTQALTGFGAPGFGWSWFYPLRAMPHTSTIEVDRNGVPASIEEWHYDPDANAIIFEEAARPEPGDVITIRYESTC